MKTPSKSRGLGRAGTTWGRAGVPLVRNDCVLSFNSIRCALSSVADDEACHVDEKLDSVSTQFHTEIKIHPNVAESFKEVTVAEFINDVEAQGSPDNRYNSFGVSFNSGYLFALDSFVYGLRQQIGAPPIQEALRKIDQDLIDAFYLYNPWFALNHEVLAEIPNEDFNLSQSGSVTTLDRLISAHAPDGSKSVLKWLGKKMKLPRSVVQHMKQA